MEGYLCKWHGPRCRCRGKPGMQESEDLWAVSWILPSVTARRMELPIRLAGPIVKTRTNGSGRSTIAGPAVGYSDGYFFPELVFSGSSSRMRGSWRQRLEFWRRLTITTCHNQMITNTQIVWGGTRFPEQLS
jgi:hypothetical protein